MEKTPIVKTEKNPSEALGKLGKDKLKGKSIQTLKKEARKEMENLAQNKIKA